MRVLLYSKPFWPMVGGVETYARLLAQGLAREKGYEVTVVTAAKGPSTPSPMLAANVRIVRAPGVPELWRIIRRSDVVMLAGPVLVPLALSLLARRPVVIEHHGYQACCPNGLLLFEPEQSVCPQRYLRGDVGLCLRCNWKTMGPLLSVASLAGTPIRRWMCRCAAANICITEHVSRRVRLPRSSVIYYGLPANDDVARLLPAPGNSRPVVFAFVGRITGEKGLPILLKAASILKTEGRKFALRLVGDGPDRLECERLARQLDLGDRLVVTGFLNGERLRQELEDVSVVVMPSIWEETAGLAAMEQMIRGRMVIAADIGGLSEVVGDAGLKFKPGDIVGLADRMRQILDAPAIIERFGECAGKRASQLYRQEQMVERYICAFNAVTQKLHFK